MIKIIFPSGIPKSHRSLLPTTSFACHYSRMSSRKFGRGGGHGQQNKEKRPPLTHFLCLPLINATSTPQLVSSLAEFKEAIPFNPVSQENSLKPQTRLVPDEALRPLGTLHFTLGVMSLQTEGRVQEAAEFLRELDLASILQEVESELSLDGKALLPLNISLTSLHALPTARNATILHAGPSDPTSRLYPFCQRLRNKFVEAGFIISETENKRDNSQGTSEAIDPENNGSTSISEVKAEETPAAPPQQQGQRSKTRRPRPLLLHATVANTIYMGRRRQRGSHKKDTYKFDSRELLSQFRDYYKEEGPSVAETQEVAAEKVEKPFIWARDIPLERLCICEMGAKDIPDNDTERKFLGQEYRAIEERKLEFS